LIDGLARNLRDSLPNASFIGFTGTPIEKTDANTRAVFGDYISIYDIQRAVADKATVPIYYESRVAKLGLNQSELPKIDEEFEAITEGEELTRKEKLKTKWAALEALVGNPKRINLVAAHLVQLQPKCAAVLLSTPAMDIIRHIVSKHPQVKVVFDTNVIYTGAAHDLLNSKIASLIAEYRNAKDITIHWCLPDVVRQEREFQMLERGMELLPAIGKLERLLGHNLAFTEEILKERVQACSAKQIAEHGLEVVEVDASSIDWQLMIARSTSRLPPFERGEKEKGFRDAIVLETFRQIIAASPASAKDCRVVLLTEDGRLGDAATAVAAEIPNARVSKGIEELRGLINVLTSEVKEELIAQVKDKVALLFFDQKNNDGLYFREKIRDRITQENPEVLAAVPANGLIRKNGTWFIYPPEFSKKTGQRVFWRTRLVVESKVFRKTALEPVDLTAPLTALSSSASLSELLEGQKEVLVKDGRTTFQVEWSVLVQTNLKLRTPKIESVKFVDTDWDKKAT